MKRGMSSTGFTIVETMIVLAITGVIFVTVAIALGGKQNASRFATSIQNVRSEIQQVGADVGNGYYPNMNNFKCVGTTSISISPLSGSETPPEQGTNTPCVFLGKVMQFKMHGTDPEEYTVFSVAGFRYGTSLPTASPVVVAPTVTSPNIPNDSVTATLQSGLTVTKMVYSDGAAPVPIGAFAFMYSFGDSTGETNAGAPDVDVYALKGTTLDTMQKNAALAVNNAMSSAVSAVKNPSGGVQICFKSGSTANQYGLVTIGGGGRQLAVKLEVKTQTSDPTTKDCGL